MVSRVDDLGLQTHGAAADVGNDVQLRDVEAELVEALDAPGDAPAVVDVECLPAGQLRPQTVVPFDHLLRGGDGVDAVVEQPAGLQVHQLAGDVDLGVGEVVASLAATELRLQFAGLGVDEIGGERASVAPEQRVGQRAVSPEEPNQVQPHQQDHEGVDQPVDCVAAHHPGEEGPVRQRVMQMPSDQYRVERLTVGRLPPSDDADRVDRGNVEPLEVV